MCFELGEIAKEVTSLFQTMFKADDGKTHTFVVQKAYCCRPEPIIEQALQTYGVKILKLTPSHVIKMSMLETMKMKRNNKLDKEQPDLLLPLAMRCEVTVKQAQAVWAEYLIERTQRLYVVKGNLNSKNRDWASAHNGVMPRPWIEKDCSEGNELWRQAEQKQGIQNYRRNK